VLQWLLQAVAFSSPASVGSPNAGCLHRVAALVPTVAALLGIFACIAAPQALQAADPSYTFNPKNESGDPAKGWYIHLPPPFTATDVIIKDSGGKILKKVRTIDRGQRTGVTVLFESDGAGVPDKGTDEIKLTLTKPLGKTGTSGFRDKDGVKGVPIGEVTWDPPWKDSKGGTGGTGGTKPKEEKKHQQAPPDEGDETLVVDGGPLDGYSVAEIPDGYEADRDGAESSPIYWSNYPYRREETNDELFGDWAAGDEWDDDSGNVDPVSTEVGVEQEVFTKLPLE